MRLELLLLVLLTLPAIPGAATSIELVTPSSVPVDGSPFEVHVRIEDMAGPGEVKLWLGGENWQASRTWNGSGFERSDRYVLDVEPDARGRWERWIPVRANPSSANHDRLTTSEEVLLSARLRGASGASARTSQALGTIEELERVPVGLGPGQVARVLADGWESRRANRGDISQVLELAVPAGADPVVCVAGRCGPSPELRLERLGPGLAVLSNQAGQPAGLAGGVLHLPEGACPLTGTLGPGEHTRVEIGEPGGCEPSELAGAPGRLIDRGVLVDQAPDPPGWGDAVRDPATAETDWAPWRIPRDTWPAPVRFERVLGQVSTFTTQDAGLESVLSVIDGARERLSLSTYLLTNPTVASALERAIARGVAVSMVLEPNPVGGLPERERDLVDRLDRFGAHVRWHGAADGERGLMHAKILVADGSVVLVLTENLTRSGLPADGQGNVGWGIGIANTSLARRVEAWLGLQGPSIPVSPAGWQPIDAEVAVLTSPENAWRESGVPRVLAQAQDQAVALLLSADPGWGPRPNLWLEGLVEASERVPVRVLLSGSPNGVRQANQAALAHLRAHPLADQLEVRLAGPRVGTVHAKGLATGDQVLVGSSNWGLGGALMNRELGLIVKDEAVASFYLEAFDDVWSPKPQPGVLQTPGPAVGLVPILGLVGLLGTTWRRRFKGS